MKTLVSLLAAASLALCAVLCVLLLRGLALPDEAAAPAPVVASAPAEVASAPKIDGMVWADLETPEVRQLADRLRASGFPPEVVRAIIGAQISEQFAQRRKAMDPDANNRPFWKNRETDAAYMTAQRQYSRDYQQALRDALGDDDFNPLVAARNQQRLGFLPKEKVKEISDITRTYEEKRSDLLTSFISGGAITITTAMREKEQALEREQNDMIRTLLSPEEYVEYELRGSRTANSLRNNLSAFNPTEEEFRAIYALQKPYDEKYQTGSLGTGPMTAEIARQRSDDQRALTAQIKQVLGPERGDFYERATNPNYRNTSQLMARLELPPETTDRLYDVQKQFEQRASEARRLPPAERTQALTNLQAEANAAIAPILGRDRNIDAYKAYSGTWITNLVPRTPPAGAGGGGGGGGDGSGFILR